MTPDEQIMNLKSRLTQALFLLEDVSSEYQSDTWKKALKKLKDRIAGDAPEVALTQKEELSFSSGIGKGKTFPIDVEKSPAADLKKIATLSLSKASVLDTALIQNMLPGTSHGVDFLNSPHLSSYLIFSSTMLLSKYQDKLPDAVKSYCFMTMGLLTAIKKNGISTKLKNTDKFNTQIVEAAHKDLLFANIALYMQASDFTAATKYLEQNAK